MKIIIRLILIIFLASGCRQKPSSSGNTTISDTTRYPSELTEFTPYKNNPVFAGTGTDTWDQKIRERGYILHEEGTYYLWYTGYKGDENVEKHLGLATSTDGLNWTRYKDNPIYDSGWVEDMCVINHDGTYYMFSEGRGDTAHMLVSTDRIHWQEKGNLDIRKVNGESISRDPMEHHLYGMRMEYGTSCMNGTTWGYGWRLQQMPKSGPTSRMNQL